MVTPRPAFRGTRGACHLHGEVCSSPGQLRSTPHSSRVAAGPGPAVWRQPSGSMLAQSAKVPRPSALPVTSHASSVCISFCFYGFWSNFNSQLFIFTKENKIAVASPFLSILVFSVLWLNQAAFTITRREVYKPPCGREYIKKKKKNPI